MKLLPFPFYFLFLLAFWATTAFAEAVLIQSETGLKYTWGVVGPMPPHTIEGPEIPLHISPAGAIQNATVAIDVWRFQIESIQTDDAGFSIQFEQHESIVTIHLTRTQPANGGGSLNLTLTPTWTEPAFDPEAKTFGRFEIIDAEVGIEDNADAATVQTVDGSWYVRDDSRATLVTARVVSDHTGEPIEGARVQLIGLADTPSLFPVNPENAIPVGADGDTGPLAFPLYVDVQALANGGAIPVWLRIDYPEGSSYESGIARIDHQPAPTARSLDLTVRVQPRSRAAGWVEYR
ncbi:MAG: hypothetical protein GC154_21005 [bacterium]|nr:hypothetical protein [bacterium]